MTPLNIDKQKIFIYFLLILIQTILFSRSTLEIPWYGKEIMKKALNPSFGRGYGARGFKRNVFQRRKYKCVFYLMKEQSNDRYFESHTRMFLNEFEILLKDLSYLKIEERWY